MGDVVPWDHTLSCHLYVLLSIAMIAPLSQYLSSSHVLYDLSDYQRPRLHDIFPILHAIQVLFPLGLRPDHRGLGRTVLPQGDPTRLCGFVYPAAVSRGIVLPGEKWGWEGERGS